MAVICGSYPGVAECSRLTSTASVESEPYFSPDGSQIAFTATVAGNTDAYVVSTSGGDPKRLTYHPSTRSSSQLVTRWQKRVFASNRTAPPLQSHSQLWSVKLDGGLPERLPMPRAASGTYSPDGAVSLMRSSLRRSFQIGMRRSMWRHYRGGRTHPISVMNLADYSVQKLPWTNSNDSFPMWLGNTIYFLSDRNHTVNLFAYRSDTKQLTQVTQHEDFDVMNASAGADAVVYEQAGYIHLVRY